MFVSKTIIILILMSKYNYANGRSQIVLTPKKQTPTE